jgi:hypothetical protein
MKTEVFAICYNEEVLMPYFLRHYSSFCEHITIYDNCSTDRSVELAQANPKATIIPFESDGLRDDIHKNIKNTCWKESKADWVIVVDFDEFLVNARGGEVLENYTIVHPGWCEMISENLPTTEGQIYDEINEGIPLEASKYVMFKPGALRAINYDVGAHTCRPVGDVRILKDPFINIFHYKMLSLDYYLKRVSLLSSRLSPLNRRKRWGYHYDFPQKEIIEFYNTCWRDKKRMPL